VTGGEGSGSADRGHQPAGAGEALPETPHELPIDRAKVDGLLDRVRQGEAVDLLEEFLAAVDWRRGFADDDGEPLALEDLARLMEYYRAKFADVGPLYLAELLSTEFMTEQRGRGDVAFSEKLLALGRDDPALWAEIRAFFRRKEFATALLALAHGRWEGGTSDVDSQSGASTRRVVPRPPGT
jgi:hypothetical protein